MSHGDTSAALFGALTGMSAAIAEVAMPSRPAAIDTISLFIVHPSLETAPRRASFEPQISMTVATPRTHRSHHHRRLKLSVSALTVSSRNARQVLIFWANPGD